MILFIPTFILKFNFVKLYYKTTQTQLPNINKHKTIKT